MMSGHHCMGDKEAVVVLGEQKDEMVIEDKI